MNLHVKVIGSVLVILSCGACGFTAAAEFRSEIRLLRELREIIAHMSWELNYRLTPLPQLCRNCAKGRCRPLAQLFEHLGQMLDDQLAPDAESCMTVALGPAVLPAAPTECLRELGRCLGKYDISGQLEGLESVREHCDKYLTQLESDKNGRVRTYQTLGLCAGAALALLLI